MISLDLPRLAGCCAVLFMTFVMSARAQDVTLEQVLSAPIPSNLVAAPRHGRVAWVVNVRGVRNVWVAEPSANGYASRPVTRYTNDDGYDLGELTWTADAEDVLYTRGSVLRIGVQKSSRVSNPTSSPRGGPPWEIWLAPASGAGQPRRLVEGRAASASPRGDCIAFVHRGQIWVAATNGEPRPRQLIQDNGDNEGRAFADPPPLRWSAAGDQLAFVSQRDGHSLIGLYDVARESIVWAAPSSDSDSHPRWSPDGRRIAFVRTASGQRPFTSSSVPWSIWIADAATGRGYRLWQADTGSGSTFVTLESHKPRSPLLWTPDNRIVFPWEKSGWLNLYAIDASGGPARELTPGSFEVFAAELSKSGKEVIYSSNEGDLDRRHLWQVAVARGERTQLSRGPGSEDVPVVSHDGRALFALHAGGVGAMQPSLLLQDGSMQALAPESLPREYPVSRMSAPQPVLLQSSDGLSLHGQLFLPARRGAEGRRPALLFFHSGPNKQMLLTWTLQEMHNYAYCLYLAARGYVVLSVNYRGSTGYGRGFREPPRFGANGGSEVHDIRPAADYLRSRPDVDARRIGIWGYSYGGLMTQLGLAHNSDLIAAGVDHAGVVNWRSLLTQAGFIERGDPRGDVMYAASPLSAIDRWRSPTLVIQSDDDRNVPFSQFVELISVLREHRVDHEQLVLPDEVHYPLLHSSWLTVFRATEDFFERRLGAVTTRRPSVSPR